MCVAALLAALLPWSFRVKKITDCNGSLYMTRTIIMEWANGSRLMVNRFHTSDHDRDLHDHPWNFRTFILSGGYFEHTAAGARWYRPGRTLQRPAQWRHRVQLSVDENGKEVPATTLVFTGPTIREWGYYTKAGWVSPTDWWAQNCE